MVTSSRQSAVPLDIVRTDSSINVQQGLVRESTLHQYSRAGMKRSAITFAGVVLTLSAGLLTLVGCRSVGPDYAQPTTSTPAEWNTPLKSGLSPAAADPQTLSQWWRVFNDSILSGLMERARVGSLDVRQAEARVREARAQRGLAEAGFFPVISVNGSAVRINSSEESGIGGNRNLFSTGFDARWELDLFGGKRRAQEAASATWQAQQEALQDVLVSLFAEVAFNYVNVRSIQTQISITESNLATQSESCDVARWRYEAGLATRLDVDQARLSLEKTRSDVPKLRTALAQTKHRLAVLVGEPPGALDELLAEPRPIPVAPIEVAVGIPADMLRHRPDVRRAERTLAAQTAQIGVATAARYPNFSLRGTSGWESLFLDTLFDAGARSAQTGINATWTLFDAGRVRRNIDMQTARQEQAQDIYEATVLVALADVEDTLEAYANGHVRRKSLAAAADAAQSAFDLARNQYSAGVIGFQMMLEAQRSLLLVQSQLASSDLEVASSLIRLYKALAGGWAAIPPAASEINVKELEMRHDQSEH